jgi:hypothetical protein
MSNTPLQALAAEAGSRLALNDYELMQDITLRAAQEHNRLGIEPFALEGGLLRCVGSRIMATEHVRLDTLAVEEDELRIRRRYPSMVAEAHLVGIWPRSGEAALYSVFAPFSSEAETPAVPFASTAADTIALGAGPYTGYKQIDASDGVVTFGKSSTWYKGGGGMHIIGTPGTKLHTDRYGVNTLDGEEGLHVHLTGPAVLRLPETAYLQVLPSGVLSSPQEDTEQPVTVPVGAKPPIRSEMRVKEGVRPVLHSDGSVILPGQEEPKHELERYRDNPYVSVEQAYALLRPSLPMHDITAQFLEGARPALLERVGAFDPQQSYDTLRAEARQAIAEYIPTGAIQPIAIGYLAVGNRVGELVAQLSRNQPWAVDKAFLEQANRR